VQQEESKIIAFICIIENEWKGMLQNIYISRSTETFWRKRIVECVFLIWKF